MEITFNFVSFMCSDESKENLINYLATYICSAYEYLRPENILPMYGS